MSSAATLNLVPVQLKMHGCSAPGLRTSSQMQFLVLSKPRRRNPRSAFPVARLFGPAIFEASKLKVLYLGVDKEKHPGKVPRAYTLTHSDITSKITLAISNSINRAQGWYNRLQRDEVVAEWRKVQSKMSLHVHCHISGGNFLLDFFANLRYYIFCKELPVVLKAFVHGDINLFRNHPEMLEAMVWVYFHSHIPEFNRVECWGPMKDATSRGKSTATAGGELLRSQPPPAVDLPRKCKEACDCCFPQYSLIPWLHDRQEEDQESAGQVQQP